MLQYYPPGVPVISFDICCQVTLETTEIPPPKCDSKFAWSQSSCTSSNALMHRLQQLLIIILKTDTYISTSTHRFKVSTICISITGRLWKYLGVIIWKPQGGQILELTGVMQTASNATGSDSHTYQSRLGPMLWQSSVSGGDSEKSASIQKDQQ